MIWCRSQDYEELKQVPVKQIRRDLVKIKGKLSIVLNKTLVVSTHQNRLGDAIQMSTHNECLYGELTKFILQLSLNTLLSVPLIHRNIYSKVYETRGFVKRWAFVNKSGDMYSVFGRFEKRKKKKKKKKRGKHLVTSFLCFISVLLGAHCGNSSAIFSRMLFLIRLYTESFVNETFPTLFYRSGARTYFRSLKLELNAWRQGQKLQTKLKLF